MLTLFDASHLEAAAAAFADVFTHAPFCYGFLDKDKALRYLGDLYRTPQFAGFCYFSEDRLCACCLGLISDYFDGPYYEIREIFTFRGFGGKGLGSRFLAETEAYLLGSGIGLVTLNTSKSLAAYEFYLKNGYAVTEGNVHMNKRLLS